MKRKKTILVVSGDPDEREQLEKILSETYQTVFCENGKEAFDYLNETFPEVKLVVMAFNLKIIEGLELLRLMKISKRLNVIPALVMIMNNDIELINKVLSCGAEDILELPLCSSVVLKRIEEVLQLSEKPTYKNVMEELVIEQIDKYIDTLDICHCSVCRCDLAALSLNHLKPKYVNTEKGRLISTTEKMSYDNMLEIVGVIAECAESVKMHPRHTAV